MKLAAEQEGIRAKCFHPSETFIEFPIKDAETSIPTRFEKMVAQHPDRIAVKSENKQLTYTELNLVANRVAHAILACCGEIPEPIGLLFPKSVGFVVAILAILKAGKIAVPMDPALPLARLALMFKDMQARLLLTDHQGFTLANTLARPDQCINIDELKANASEENPCLPLSPDALACLFYTSGSTGMPKGVMENHLNLLRHTMRDTNDFHFCPEDKMTFVATAGRDIFRAVLNGATVCPIDIRREGFVGLGTRLVQEEITIYNSVTSAFRNFAGALTGCERFPHMRLIMVTGEAVRRSDFELYRKYFPNDHCVLVNRYGPNESGGLVSQYLMDKSSSFTGGAVPVGYATRDKEIHLIDESGKPADLGQPGEIVVTSRNLSPGYWRQPERTREVFQVDPVDNNMRTYHTGDIGVMDPDGCLTYLGRKDFQVKIRGNKVEMSAVETALLNMDTVREAAVIALEGDAGDKRLVAYIVSHHVPLPTTSDLRNALAATLPNYMVPSLFVFLDKLPVTGIGKVDRKSLSDPGRGRPTLNTPYVAPRNPVEAKLAQIWSEVLSVEQVGIHDSFFDLGGHSLAASSVISRIIQSFQMELPIRVLLNSPTVADMANVVLATEAKPSSDEDLQRMLDEVEALSDDEVLQAVTERKAFK